MAIHSLQGHGKPATHKQDRHVYGLEQGDQSVLNTRYWHILTVRRGLQICLSGKNEYNYNDTVLANSSVLTMPVRNASFLSEMISEMKGK